MKIPSLPEENNNSRSGLEIKTNEGNAYAAHPNQWKRDLIDPYAVVYYLLISDRTVRVISGSIWVYYATGQ